MKNFQASRPRDASRSHACGKVDPQVSGLIRTLDASDSSAGDPETVSTRLVRVEKSIFRQTEDPPWRDVDGRVVPKGNNRPSEITTRPCMQGLVHPARDRNRVGPVVVGVNACSIRPWITHPPSCLRAAHNERRLGVGITQSLASRASGSARRIEMTSIARVHRS